MANVRQLVCTEQIVWHQIHCSKRQFLDIELPSMPLHDFDNLTFQDNVPDWNEFGTEQSNEEILVTHNLRELQRMMADYVGIVRSDFRLERAMRRLKLIKEETEEFLQEKPKLSMKLCAS